MIHYPGPRIDVVLLGDVMGGPEACGYCAPKVNGQPVAGGNWSQCTMTDGGGTVRMQTNFFAGTCVEWEPPLSPCQQFFPCLLDCTITVHSSISNLEVFYVHGGGTVHVGTLASGTGTLELPSDWTNPDTGENYVALNCGAFLEITFAGDSGSTGAITFACAVCPP